MSTIVAASALKLDKTEKNELTALLKSFDWTIAPDDGGTFALITKLGALVAKYENRQIAERRALETLRLQMQGKIAMQIAAEKNAESPVQRAMMDAAAKKLASVDASADAPSLEDQLTEIATGGAVSKVADLITFAFRDHEPDTYPAFKALARKNPPFGDKSLVPLFTAEQASARAAFLLCHGWEREARKRAGIVAIPRGETGPKATSTPAKRASALASALDSFILGSVLLQSLPQTITIAEGRAMLGERYAAAITIPLYYPGEVDVTYRAPVTPAPKIAPASESLMTEARELSADLERDVFIIRVGKRHEMYALKREKMAAKYANTTDAFLVSIVSPDGSVNRLTTPEQLSVAIIPAAIVASLSPPVDPASVVNVVNPLPATPDASAIPA